jgi:hypothetical protein
VAAIDTPAADVYMDMTSSMPVEVEARPVRMPLRVPLAPDGQARRYLIDFGRMTIGWIELEVEAPAGTTFDLLGYEGVQDGRPQMPAWMNNTLRYICRDGRQTYVSTLRRGLRYLIVAVHGTAGEAVLHGVKLRLATYPWSIQGAFRCSDPRLNQIWEACAYTLRLCSEDTFTDCPTYEQTFWTGDACLTDLLLHMAVHGDARLPRRCLLLVADSLQRLPIGGAQVPGDWENTLLPNWSWLWAMGCAEYYQLTGDDEFARLAYPALAKQARFIEAARNAAGLVELIGYWHLLDWVRIPDGPEFILAHESCLAVGALNATATIARAAGQPFEAGHWQAVAGELAAAVNRECWRADQQAYGDTWLAPGVEVPAIASASDGTSTARVDTVSQPTNIVALLAGVAPPERAAAIRPRLLDCPEGWVASGTPWMHSLACHVWAEHGDLEPVLDTIRDRWGDMLDKAATTTWETFVGFDVLKGWWTRSWCHAWSAFPAYLLSAYVLGVRPLEPGFRRALVAPRLADLTWAEGRVPTPHGAIGVRLDQAGAGMAVQVTLPEGVAAEVRLPVLGEAPPAVDGAWAEIARAGAEYVIRLPAGAIVTIHT